MHQHWCRVTSIPPPHRQTKIPYSPSSKPMIRSRPPFPDISAPSFRRSGLPAQLAHPHPRVEGGLAVFPGHPHPTPSRPPQAAPHHFQARTHPLLVRRQEKSYGLITPLATIIPPSYRNEANSKRLPCRCNHSIMASHQPLPRLPLIKLLVTAVMQLGAWITVPFLPWTHLRR